VTPGLFLLALTLGLPLGSHPCKPFALVASPRPGLRHSEVVCFFFGVKFHQIFTSKICFQHIQRIFHEKKNPNSPYMGRIYFFSRSPDFNDPVDPECRRIMFFKNNLFLNLYLICSQIWLNYLMNDHQFNYITKLKKRKKKKKVNPKTLEHPQPYILEFKTLKFFCSELHEIDLTVKGFLIR
jgi:hypothetical protein